MLYDMKWERAPRGYTIDDVIAWLETRDPNERYSFTHAEDCLAARFLQAHGVARYELDSEEIDDVFFPRMQEIAMCCGTMGDALMYARRVKKEEMTVGARIRTTLLPIFIRSELTHA